MTVDRSSLSRKKLLVDPSSEVLDSVITPGKFHFLVKTSCIRNLSPGRKLFGADLPFFWASSICFDFLLSMSMLWSTNLVREFGRQLLGDLPIKCSRTVFILRMCHFLDLVSFQAVLQGSYTSLTASIRLRIEWRRVNMLDAHLLEHVGEPWAETAGAIAPTFMRNSDMIRPLHHCSEYLVWCLIVGQFPPDKTSDSVFNH